MAELTPLHIGARLAISDYRCRCGKGGPAAEEFSSTTDIVFVRRGVFCRHIERREEVADPNHVLFFQAGQEYKISHPAHAGDDCTVLSFTPEFAQDALTEWASDRSLTEIRPFAESSRCVSPTLFHRHWQLLRLITMAAPTLEIEETTCEIIGRILSEQAGADTTQRRESTRKAHRDLANEAKLLLNSSLTNLATLDVLATSLGTSPFHLSRVFKQQVRMGLADYAIQLRIHCAAERLTRTRLSVGTIAATLGFSSASYFVYRFHQITGMTPVQYRSTASIPSRIAI